jgi:hypothetical protein
LIINVLYIKKNKTDGYGLAPAQREYKNTMV